MVQCPLWCYIPMVQWYMPAGIARCLDNSICFNMFQPMCSAPPRKENARGNKRKSANVSVSRGKYPVFDFLHSPQSTGEISVQMQRFLRNVKVTLCSKSEGGTDVIAMGRL